MIILILTKSGCCHTNCRNTRPGLAVADVDGNGLDDIYVGGSVMQPGTFLLQQADGNFIQKFLPEKTFAEGKPENMGVLLFDADGDGDNDLMVRQRQQQIRSQFGNVYR